MAHVNHASTVPSGWVTFAGSLMILAGFLQALAGLVALFNPNLFLVNSSHVFILNLTQWGWVHLIIGIILILSAFSLFAGQLWGRIVAITLATISAIANFGFIGVYPIWSLVIIALDIVIIYSVAMYDRVED